ncbi:MAG: S49 family peptidase [Magnetococcus sp. YQC-3]
MITKITSILIITILFFVIITTHPTQNNNPVKIDKKILSANNVITELEKLKKFKKINIIADNEGGEVVQGEKIYNYINYLKSLNIEVITTIDNICVSSCYYAISSSNKIIASKNSILGGIGVLFFSNNQQQVFSSSGKYKDGHINSFFIHNHMNMIAKNLHNNIIDDITKSRGNKLINPVKNNIFEGLVWDGNSALQLGLIDEIR